MILYHRTSKENIPSILKEGLRPNGFNIVYLSPITDTDFGDTLLQVETRDLKLTAFDGCEEWEVLCWGAIPPEDIKVLTKEDESDKVEKQ